MVVGMRVAPEDAIVANSTTPSRPITEYSQGTTRPNTVAAGGMVGMAGKNQVHPAPAAVAVAATAPAGLALPLVGSAWDISPHEVRTYLCRHFPNSDVYLYTLFDPHASAARTVATLSGGAM